MVDSWSPTRHHGGPLLIVIEELLTCELGTYLCAMMVSSLKQVSCLKTRCSTCDRKEFSCHPWSAATQCCTADECSQACLALERHHDASYSTCSWRVFCLGSPCRTGRSAVLSVQPCAPTTAHTTPINRCHGAVLSCLQCIGLCCIALDCAFNSTGTVLYACGLSTLLPRLSNVSKMQ